MINGKDGTILWSLKSAKMQMSSDLSLKTLQPNFDRFIMRVQGRGSLYTWDLNSHLTKPKDKGVDDCIKSVQVTLLNRFQVLIRMKYSLINCENAVSCISYRCSRSHKRTSDAQLNAQKISSIQSLYYFKEASL